MTNELQTLSQRLAEGPIPLSEALGLAVQLGDALRRVHDEGRIQGALTPDVVNLKGSKLELLPAEPGAAAVLTPYSAPELLHGHAPDVRTDIFAFGAVLYEILTGCRAFRGDTSQALAESISTSVPAPIGVAGLDRLVSACLSKDPAGRWQRMQHVVTEARLAATRCRAERGSVPRHKQIEQALRAEMEMLESRLASQLEQYEVAIADLHRDLVEELARQQAASKEAVSEALQGLRGRLDETEPQLDAALERSAFAEQAAERALGEIAGLQGAVSAELQGLTDKITAHSAAIESGRAGIARTDDLVERVVEALEVIQGMVIEQSEGRAAFAGS
jgi:hypothetical protein